MLYSSEIIGDVFNVFEVVSVLTTVNDELLKEKLIKGFVTSFVA